MVPLTSRRNLLVALAILVAATRFLAVSQSIWDWDEGLFVSAMRDYDVAAHRPHPSGFPLFIGAAKLARFLVDDDFKALRAVSVIASMFLFPALYSLARALRMSFRSAVIAALLFSFLPNVWYWGGTAFSDVLAVVLFLTAAALLFRGGGGYLLGSVFFAATLLVRPQNLLLVWPWLFASWQRLRARKFADVAASAALITVLVLGGYWLAGRASGGWTRYIKATRDHQEYVATVDGALNPNRPKPTAVFRDFFIDPFFGGKASTLLFLFALAAFLRPQRRHLDILLTFLPNLVLGWFMLSVTGVSRLSLGYIPMHTLLAADGMAAIAAILMRRRERFVPALETAFAAVILLRFVYWVWPALAEVRRHNAPPMAAVRWLREHVPPTGKIYVHGGMTPFTDCCLRDRPTALVADDFDPRTMPPEPGAYFVVDRELKVPRAVIFTRPRPKLWGLFHRRYFEITVVPIAGAPGAVAGAVQLADGWHFSETDEHGRPYRWMGGRSRTVLGALPGPGLLEMSFFAPLDVGPPSNVTIAIDGVAIDRFRPSEAHFRRVYRLEAKGKPAELTIEVDRVVNPARLGLGGDARDLGLRVSSMTWRTAPR
jgi:hypothetical protein